MKWTKEQEEAILARKKSILVSAAAGSGKTAVLVERIKQLLINDQVSLDEILVVTFTKAAASEMKEKIVSAIPEQMTMIQRSNIGTFHSFALDVIGKYFHIIDLEPGFRVCDDARRILLKNEAMDLLFEENFQQNNEEFLNFLNMYGTSRSEDNVKKMISDVFDFIMSMEKPFEWLAESTGAVKDEIVYKELLKNINKMIATAKELLNAAHEILLDNNISSLISKAETDLLMVEGIENSFKDNYELGKLSLNQRAFQRFVCKKDEKLAYEEVKGKIDFLRNKAKDILKKVETKYGSRDFHEYIDEISETQESAKILEKLIVGFHENYSKLKKSKGLLDFSDIEHFALKILSKKEVADEYKEKFKYIFIDEYQDSNLVQEALIQKIQRPDNVFMVGDVKQSIYKFRLAEPEIFMEKYESIKKDNDPSKMKIDLNKNFRSKGPIIKTVNDTFDFLMNEDTAGMAYDNDAALYKGIEYDGELEHKTELHLLDGGKTEDEAKLIASIIKENIGLPYYDVKSGRKKEIKYKDIVLLLRSAATSAEIYKEELENVGIPAFIDAGDGYYDSLEISVFLNLLKIIDNKAQDIPLISVLRSPIFDLDIEEMAIIRGENPKTSFLKALQGYSKEGNDPNLRFKIESILSEIATWKKRQRYLSLKDFIWELMLKTRFYYYVGALPGGTQRQANLKALADKALAYENSQGKGLFGFINYIEAVKEKKIATPPVSLLGEGDNVVRIMTVHKSKGLEYPFVILGGLGKQFNRDSGKASSFHKDLGLALKYVDTERSCYRKTLLQKLIEDRLEAEAFAEEIRILYVAMTRAMDKLIMVGSSKNIESLMERSLIMGKGGIGESRNYLEMVLKALLDEKKVDLIIHKSDDLQAVENIIDRVDARKIIGDIKERELVDLKLAWQYPYEKALNNKAKYSVSELSREMRANRKPIGSKGSSDGALRGTIYHKIIERLPFDGSIVNDKDLLLFIEELLASNILLEDEKQMIDIRKINLFIKSSLFTRMIKAEETYKEVPFNLLKEKNGEEIMVQGIIDCYFKEKGSYILVDFKSDYTDGSKERENELLETYRPQLELYREALEKINNKKVGEIYLYLIDNGKSLKLS